MKKLKIAKKSRMMRKKMRIMQAEAAVYIWQKNWQLSTKSYLTRIKMNLILMNIMKAKS